MCYNIIPKEEFSNLLSRGEYKYMSQSLTYQNKKFQDFDSELKVDLREINQENKRKEFILYLANHLELLENFSNEQLGKILKYSEEENKKKRKLLKNNCN